jgi:uncharacterized protein (TIGR02996 family)
MTPIERTFLTDIFATPEDDTPRLIYADWLEDNGRPERADFIRVQCRIACLASARRGSRAGKERDELLARELVLWRLRRGKAYVARRLPGEQPAFPGLAHLIPQLDKAPTSKRQTLIWERGFGHTVRCKLDPWLSWGAELCQHHPVVAVKITDCRPLEAGWYGTDVLTLRTTANLPVVIWDLLTGFTERGAGWTHYAGKEQALAALDAAAIAWARK